MFEGELIVKVFLFGLILVAPDNRGTPDTADDTLVAYLLDGAERQGSNKHQGILQYCGREGNDECKQVELSDVTVRFEFVERCEDSSQAVQDTREVPIGANHTQITSQRVAYKHRCDPEERSNKKPPALCDRGVRYPTGHPYSAVAADFDWVAKLSAVGGDVATMDTLEPHSEKISARAVFEEGTMSVCRYVTVPENCLVVGGSEEKRVIPEVQFFGSDYPPRAMAESLVVESSSTGSECLKVWFDPDDNKTAPEPVILRPHSCDEDSSDQCIELAISNLPDGDWRDELRVECSDDITDNIRQLTAYHWKFFYDAFAGGPGPRPYPVPIAQRTLPTHEDLSLGCSEVDDWIQDLVGVPYVDDRPICPIGTP